MTRRHGPVAPKRPASFRQAASKPSCETVNVSSRNPAEKRKTHLDSLVLPKAESVTPSSTHAGEDDGSRKRPRTRSERNRCWSRTENTSSVQARDLPIDIWGEIMRHLRNPKDQCNLASVCKYFLLLRNDVHRLHGRRILQYWAKRHHDKQAEETKAEIQQGVIWFEEELTKNFDAICDSLAHHTQYVIKSPFSFSATNRLMERVAASFGYSMLMIYSIGGDVYIQHNHRFAPQATSLTASDPFRQFLNVHEKEFAAVSQFHLVQMKEEMARVESIIMSDLPQILEQLRSKSGSYEIELKTNEAVTLVEALNMQFTNLKFSLKRDGWNLVHSPLILVLQLSISRP